MPTPDVFYTFDELLGGFPPKVKIYKDIKTSQVPYEVVKDESSEVAQLKRTIEELHNELERVHNLLSRSIDLLQAHAEMSKYLKHNKIPFKLPKTSTCVTEFIKALSLATVEPPDDVLAE